MYRARAADFGGFLVLTVGGVKYLIGNTRRDYHDR